LINVYTKIDIYTINTLHKWINGYISAIKHAIKGPSSK